jgi:peptidoglycan hydrolase-like protein with peptidoglycan-binding domain
MASGEAQLHARNARAIQGMIESLVSQRALRRGDKGDAVRALQLTLRALGHEIVVNGDFGGVTYGAVTISAAM